MADFAAGGNSIFDVSTLEIPQLRWQCCCKREYSWSSTPEFCHWREISYYHTLWRFRLPNYWEGQ